MASGQMARRENTTSEREIHVEKDRVPKMTTHFEHLAVDQGKETPQGSIEALQGGERNIEHAGKAIGDVGGRGKARETHELGGAAGGHFESLADKVRGTTAQKDRKENKQSDRDRSAAAANVAIGGAKVGGGEAKREEREGFGGVRNVGKFEMKAEGDNESLSRGREEDLERRTRAVTGTTKPESINKERNREMGKGQVVAERGRKKEEEEAIRDAERNREMGKGQVVAERGRKKEEEEAIRDAERLRGRVLGAENVGAEERLRGRVHGAENVVGATRGKGYEQTERGREESERSPTLEEISRYRNQAQQSAKEAISAAQEKYERANQAAKETLGNTTTQEEKDIATVENEEEEERKQQQQKSYAEATKETISGAAKTAAGYTAPVAEKAKCAGGSTASYVGEKAVQAKDVTVETGKTAAEYAGKVAADLKDKATVAGWTAAKYSTDVTVEGTRAAANVVEGAAGYAGHKAAELAAKSVDVVKGLAASAGETAKEYTTRKKEEVWREYEAKKAAQNLQEGEEKIVETVSQYPQQVKPSTGVIPKGGQAVAPQGGTGTQEGTVSNVISAIGETVGNVGEKVKKPFQNITGGGKNDQSSGQQVGVGKGGSEGAKTTTTTIGEKLGNAAEMMKNSEVVGAVGETVGEIGGNMMKPAERVQGQKGGGGGGGVLDAIGETIAEIAQTTKVIVVGEGGEGEELRQSNIGSESLSADRGRHEGDLAARSV